MPLHVGNQAPEFELQNQDKQPIKLSEFRGKRNVVLLFYPMDFSPVCSEEHCSFGPNIGEIAGGEDTVIFGVSCDGPYSHAAFRKQFNIPYDLLSDVTRKTSKDYDLFAGELPYNCSKRGTVIIDKLGKIAHWNEQPMREARKSNDLAKLVADAVHERENEGGSAV